ncbi:hypothetical protein K443DRAFT_115480, partial [Laccaria amethystina LaAM-08-1]
TTLKIIELHIRPRKRIMGISKDDNETGRSKSPSPIAGPSRLRRGISTPPLGNMVLDLTHSDEETVATTSVPLLSQIETPPRPTIQPDPTYSNVSDVDPDLENPWMTGRTFAF